MFQGVNLNRNPIDYKKSGVDVQAGDDLIDWLNSSSDAVSKDTISNDAASNSQKQFNEFRMQQQHELKNRVVSGIGGFAALFKGQFDHIKNPLLVSCTDGVGTKVKIASYFNDYSTVGYDLVAMCANDLICTGGRPLFFLDYYASGKLQLENAKSFLTCVRSACFESEMILIGGETAEMPGVYQQNDFDCAGFSVGVVDEESTWGAHRVQDGDVLIGFKSSGYHSNGFSLIRKVFDGEYENYKTWLLEPTRIYVSLIREISKYVNIHAAAHITGGGVDNIPRIVSPHLKAVIQNWKLTEPFLEVQKRSGLSKIEMLKTLNCGIGFVLCVSPDQLEPLKKICLSLNENMIEIGHIQRKNTEDSELEISDI